MNKIILVIPLLILSGCSTKPTQPLTVTEAPQLLPVIAISSSPLLLCDLFWHHPLEYNNPKESSSHLVSLLQVESDTELNQIVPQESLLPRITRYLKQGIASWYGPGFHGKKTATGEVFDMYAMTAAHKTLPIPSYAQVTNLENHRSVIVRINDRGPYVGNRELDLSYAAAKKLGMHEDGLGAVEIKAVTPGQALPQLQQAAAEQEKNVYLQIGSFGSQKKARKLQNKIAAHHLPTSKIRSSTHKKYTLYKVQLGPINSAASADKLYAQLAEIGITNTQFVTETKQTHYAMIQ